MSLQNLEVSVRWESNAWVIREAGCFSGPGIRADAMVIEPRNSRPGDIRGTIVSVHGIDQEIARQLSFADLRQLGVGSHVTRRGNPSGRVLYLMTNGSVEKGG